MILRATKILHTDGTEVFQHPAIRIGDKYLVLGFFIDPASRLVRIRDRYGTPSLWPIEAFEVTSDLIPANWCGSLEVVGERTVFRIGPRPFMREGFWDEYFDDAEQAVAEYEREVEDMISNEGYGDL